MLRPPLTPETLDALEIWTPSGLLRALAHRTPETAPETDALLRAAVLDLDPVSLDAWLSGLQAAPMDEAWLECVEAVALAQMTAHALSLSTVETRLGAFLAELSIPAPWRFGGAAHGRRFDVLPWSLIVSAASPIDSSLLNAWLEGRLSPEQQDRCLQELSKPEILSWYQACLQERAAEISVLAWDPRWHPDVLTEDVRSVEPAWTMPLPHLGGEARWIRHADGLYLHLPSGQQVLVSELLLPPVCLLDATPVAVEHLHRWDSGAGWMESRIHILQGDPIRSIDNAMSSLDAIVAGELPALRSHSIVTEIVTEIHTGVWGSWLIEASRSENHEDFWPQAIVKLVKLRLCLNHAVDSLDSPLLDAALIRLDLAHAPHSVALAWIEEGDWKKLENEVEASLWWGERKAWPVVQAAPTRSNEETSGYFLANLQKNSALYSAGAFGAGLLKKLVVDGRELELPADALPYDFRVHKDGFWLDLGNCRNIGDWIGKTVRLRFEGSADPQAQGVLQEDGRAWMVPERELLKLCDSSPDGRFDLASLSGGDGTAILFEIQQ